MREDLANCRSVSACVGRMSLMVRRVIVGLLAAAFAATLIIACGAANAMHPGP